MTVQWAKRFALSESIGLRSAGLTPPVGSAKAGACDEGARGARLIRDRRHRFSFLLRRARSSWIPVLLLFLAAGVGTQSSGIARAQGRLSDEYRVKAAFLYNFAKFVEWPRGESPESQGAVVIGVDGEDQLCQVVEQTVAGKTVNGREFQVRRWKLGQNLSQILQSLRGSSVLTVGESKRFARQGGVINLFIEENNVRFEINVEAATRARLRISSKLLALARIVTSQGNGRS